MNKTPTSTSGVPIETARGDSSVGVERLDPGVLDSPLPAGWMVQQLNRGSDGSCKVLTGHPNADAIELPLPPASAPADLWLGLISGPGFQGAELQVRLGVSGPWRRLRPMRFLRCDHVAVQPARVGPVPARQTTLHVRPAVDGPAAIAWWATAPPAAPISRSPGRAAALFDGAMVFGGERIEHPGAIDDILAPYADSDITDICWGTAVGSYRPLYLSRVLD